MTEISGWSRRIAAGLATLAVVGLGVFVLGRLADTPAVAMGLTVAWFAAALVVAALVVRRRRGLAVPVAGGYLLAAVATGVLVGLPTVVNRTVNDADVPVVVAPGPAGSGPTGASDTTPTAAAGTAGTAAPAAAVEIGRAGLVGIDHRASGTARLIRLPDGSLLVRLDRIDVQPGPDYYAAWPGSRATAAARTTPCRATARSTPPRPC